MTVFLEDNKKSEQVKIQDSEKNAVITLLVFITAVYLIAIVFRLASGQQWL